MIQSGKDGRVRSLSPDDLEGVIGGAGGGDGQDTNGVSCPVCGCKFSLPEGKSIGKCPDCGATVTKKK